MNPIYRSILFAIFVVCILSCNKQNEWLDVKKNKSDVVPKTLENFQAILDNDVIMNFEGFPGMGVIGADNFWQTQDNWKSLGTTAERTTYIWEKDVWKGESSFDWNNAYRMVSYANVVLEGIEKIPVTESTKEVWNSVKGGALFFRSIAFYNLLQLFAKPYDKNTAESDLGIPLRLSSDVNIKVSRSTVKQCYDKIITDLKSAENLLPKKSTIKTRPSKLAVQALLSKIFLTTLDFENAFISANNVLLEQNTLLNFSELPEPQPYTFPFPSFQINNIEILFYAKTNGFSLLTMLWYNSEVKIDSILYKSYSDDDLRKKLFFTNNFGGTNFQGSYAGDYSLFAGIAINEIYLIRAESNIRQGRIQDGLNDLNVLLRTRWAPTKFIEYTTTNSQEALNFVLQERNKELPFTNSLRWEDLRRLNKEGVWNKTLVRKLGEETYTLPPNDNRYVLPIPPDEIRLTGIEQNPR